MFPNINKLYKSVWKSMIKPQKIDYDSSSLGPRYENIDGTQCQRQDFEIENIKGQKLKVTLFLPYNAAQKMDVTHSDHSDSELSELDITKVKESPNDPNQVDGGAGLDLLDETLIESEKKAKDKFMQAFNTPNQNKSAQENESKNSIPEDDKVDCVIFLHTHNGCRLQGIDLKNFLIPKNKAVCLFDFHGSGLSEGSYVSFGWYETFDLDSIIIHLKKMGLFKNICLWGRSMGAACALYYTSKAFRTLMSEQVYGKGPENQEMKDPFQPIEYINSIVLDSPYEDLSESIIQLVTEASSFIPRFLVVSSLKIINIYNDVETIQDRGCFNIFQLKPTVFSDLCFVPAFFIKSEKDEILDHERFMKLFINYNFVKKLRVVPGTHGSERENGLMEEATNFIVSNCEDQEMLEGSRILRTYLMKKLDPSYQAPKRSYKFDTTMDSQLSYIKPEDRSKRDRLNSDYLDDQLIDSPPILNSKKMSVNLKKTFQDSEECSIIKPNIISDSHRTISVSRDELEIHNIIQDINSSQGVNDSNFNPKVPQFEYEYHQNIDEDHSENIVLSAPRNQLTNIHTGIPQGSQLYEEEKGDFRGEEGQSNSLSLEEDLEGGVSQLEDQAEGEQDITQYQEPDFGDSSVMKTGRGEKKDKFPKEEGNIEDVNDEDEYQVGNVDQFLEETDTKFFDEYPSSKLEEKYDDSNIISDAVGENNPQADKTDDFFCTQNEEDIQANNDESPEQEEPVQTVESPQPQELAKGDGDQLEVVVNVAEKLVIAEEEDKDQQENMFEVQPDIKGGKDEINPDDFTTNTETQCEDSTFDQGEIIVGALQTHEEGLVDAGFNHDQVIGGMMKKGTENNQEMESIEQSGDVVDDVEQNDRHSEYFDMDKLVQEREEHPNQLILDTSNCYQDDDEEEQNADKLEKGVQEQKEEEFIEDELIEKVNSVEEEPKDEIEDKQDQEEAEEPELEVNEQVVEDKDDLKEEQDQDIEIVDDDDDIAVEEEEEEDHKVEEYPIDDNNNDIDGEDHIEQEVIEDTIEVEDDSNLGNEVENEAEPEENTPNTDLKDQEQEQEDIELSKDEIENDEEFEILKETLEDEEIEDIQSNDNQEEEQEQQSDIEEANEVKEDSYEQENKDEDEEDNINEEKIDFVEDALKNFQNNDIQEEAAPIIDNKESKISDDFEEIIEKDETSQSLEKGDKINNQIEEEKKPVVNEIQKDDQDDIPDSQENKQDEQTDQYSSTQRTLKPLNQLNQFQFVVTLTFSAEIIVRKFFL